MIKPLTFVTFLLACGSGLYLYQSKHEAQVLDRTIEKTVHDTATYREQSRLLAAEWTMLNDPETLRRFSDTYLALKTITPSQFTSLNDLDNRLPPLPQPAQGPDELPPVPVASDQAPDVVETAPALIADAAESVSRPIGSSPVAPAVTAPARTAERKVAAVRSTTTEATSHLRVAETVSRPVGADAAYRPTASEPGPASRTLTSAEPRPSAQRLVEPRVADRRPAPSAETRSTEARTAESHAAAALPQPQPMVVAAASRPAVPGPLAPSSGATASGFTTSGAASPMVTSSSLKAPVAATRLAVPTPVQAPLPQPYTGSLLGMARSSAFPQAPRPTPVSASQPYNAN